MIRKWIVVFSLIVFSYFIFFSGRFSSDDPGKYVVPAGFYHQVDEELAQVSHNKVSEVFERLHRRGGFNGNVIYSEFGRVVYKESFGFADLRKRRDSLAPGSAFQLASVSKMFTATAIMILAEEGKIGYDDPVENYIFGFPYPGVTIRHLLTHRSGLPRYMSLTDRHWNNKKLITNRNVVDLLIRYKPGPYFSPDNGFHYCNTNYMLLACVVEAVSKISFDKFVKSRIFDPAGMSGSFVYNHNGLDEVPYRTQNGVPGHEGGHRWYRTIGDHYLNGVMGDKGVYSTVEDLFRFDSALTNEVLVSRETLSEAFSPASPPYRNRKDNYGFGWRIRDGMDSAVYHFGWWKGFRSYYIRDMARERTLIVLCNNTRGISSKILWDLLEQEWQTGELVEIYRKLRQRNEMMKS